MLGVVVWSMIVIRCAIAWIFFAVCIMLIRRLRRDAASWRAAGENGIIAEIIEGEIRGIKSESKWLCVMGLTASIRIVTVIYHALIGAPVRSWDRADIIGILIVMAFTLHSGYVVWAKRRERVRLYRYAQQELQAQHAQQELLKGISK